MLTHSLLNELLPASAPFSSKTFPRSFSGWDFSLPLPPGIFTRSPLWLPSFPGRSPRGVTEPRYREAPLAPALQPSQTFIHHTAAPCPTCATDSPSSHELPGHKTFYGYFTSAGTPLAAFISARFSLLLSFAFASFSFGAPSPREPGLVSGSP